MSALKMLSVDFNNLACDKAFDIIPSQDPRVSMRIYLGISNWMNRKGDNVRQKFRKYTRVVRVGDTNRFVFRFKNPKDKSLQEVAVDGTGAIALDGLKPADLGELNRYVMLETAGATELGPQDILKVFKWMHGTRHARVFLATTQDEARTQWHRIGPGPEKIVYGGYLPNPVRTATIGYRGPVTFELGEKPVAVQDGGFVVFPQLVSKDVQLAGNAGIFALCAARGSMPAIVLPKVLGLDRTLPDDTPIPKPVLRPPYRAKRLAITA